MILRIVCISFFVLFIMGVSLIANALANAITIEEITTEQETKNMAKTDFTYCKGINCPSRKQCLRFVNGLEAAKESDKNHSWIKNCRHAKLFIHKDGSET